MQSAGFQLSATNGGSFLRYCSPLPLPPPLLLGARSLSVSHICCIFCQAHVDIRENVFLGSHGSVNFYAEPVDPITARLTREPTFALFPALAVQVRERPIAQHRISHKLYLRNPAHGVMKSTAKNTTRTARETTASSTMYRRFGMNRAHICSYRVSNNTFRNREKCCLCM